MAITTLRIMGKTATATADTPAFREWASRLATKAPPRDYVEQLHEIYDGVIARWRYVLENGEWVHGTPRSLIAHVLGTKYDQPDTRPELADLSRPSPAGKFGFGDCDDVATAVAAAVLAIGQRPLFRVSAPPLHVSVVAITPKGKMVSVDPVGHPEHRFGWAAPSHSGQVRYFDMQGNEVAARPWPVQGPFVGIEGNAMQQGQVQFYDGIDGVDDTPDGTYFMTPDAVPRNRVKHPHLAYVRSTDLRGPRVLAIPMRTMRQLQAGACPDGAAGVDEFGEEYEYDGTRDLWMQNGSMGALAMLHDQNLDEMDDEQYAANYGWGYADYQHIEGFGISRRKRRQQRRAKRRARRRARRKRIRAGARKFFKRIGRGLRKVGSKVLAPILRSKWAQRIIGRGLSALGIPARLTKMFMAAAGSIIKDVGVVGLIRMIRKDRKKALRILAAAGKAGLKAATRLAGVEGDPRGELLQTWTVQDGAEFPSQHVIGFIGVPGIYGQVDVDVADEPTPGAWYRVHKGDTLLGVTGEAFAIKPSTKELRRERLAKSRWINQAAVNQVYFDTSLADSLYRDGRISFRPRFACDPAAAIAGERGGCYPLIYIPIMKGDEPAAIEPEPPPGPTPDMPEPPVEPAPEPEPEPLPVPPAVVEPSTPLPDVDEPEPGIPGTNGLPPVPPVEPEPAPAEPDHPEPSPEPKVECPEWFEPSPTDPTVCRPVAAPGGSGCPPGMIWRSVAQGGPPPLGGCVRLLPPAPTPDVPDVPDLPEPEPAPPAACPPGYVRASDGSCIRHLAPTAPPYQPPAPTPAPTPAPGPYQPPMMPPSGDPSGAPPLGLAALLFILLNA